MCMLAVTTWFGTLGIVCGAQGESTRVGFAIRARFLLTVGFFSIVKHYREVSEKGKIGTLKDK